MKKLLSIFLAVPMLLSFAACRDNSAKEDITTTATDIAEQSTSQITEAATQPKTEAATEFTGELSCVTVGFAEDFVDYNPDEWDYSLTPPYATYIAYEGDYGEYVGFMANDGGNIRDFRFYSLENVDFVDGKLIFDKTELFDIGNLGSMAPVLIRMDFPGTMPSYAFSYIDEEGTKAFTLNLSGEDGSIVVDEIEF